MTPPKHIWSGDWRSESEAEERRRREAEGHAANAGDDDAASTTSPPPSGSTSPPPTASGPARGSRRSATAPPPPDTASNGDSSRRSRRGAGLLVTALVALIAAGLGAGGTVAYLDHRGATADTSRPAAIPLATDRAATPKRGQTIANAVFEADGPAVASIQTGSGSGTGFLVKAGGAGTIVTNDHVVESASGGHVQVRFGTHGTIMTGRVIATDPSSDLAVVKVDPSKLPKNAKPLQFADSDDLQVGDAVVAIGNPFGLERTVTTGVVSSLDRQITAPNNYQIDGVIQTDAAINPGNSGGPLLDANGNVIGVNSQIATSGAGSQGNVGIGFAVPSNTIRQVLPALAAGKQVEHAWLGVESSPTTNGQSGASVSVVTPGGPAEGAGVRVGDVLTKVDGQAVRLPSDVSTVINRMAPGDHITLTVRRGGTERTIKVTLGNRPTNNTP